MRKENIFHLFLSLFVPMICGSAHGAIQYDQNITPDIIFGSGNSNGEFTVDTNEGVEVGLRAKIPYNGTVNSGGDGTYSYTLAETDYDDDPGTDNRWNFDFTINTNFDGSSGNNLDAYTYELGVDSDPSLAVSYEVADPVLTPVFGVLAPDHSLGTNATANGGGVTGGFWYGDYEDELSNYNVLQQSWYYSLGSSALPNFSYNPNIPGTYAIYLLVKDGNGVVVARTDIQVLIGGAPAAVVPAAPLGVLDLIAADDSGAVDSDDITNINLPGLDVVCTDAAHLVTLYSDQPSANTVIGTHQCTTVSIEQAMVTSVLTDGDHNISYSETNTVGESIQSPALIISIDTVNPTDPVVDGIGNTFVSVTGTSEAYSAVNMAGASCTNGPVFADVGGDWVCDLASALAENVVFSAIATDIAGNSSGQTDMVVLDVNDAPVFLVSCDIDATDVTGNGNYIVNYPAYAYGFSVGPGNESAQDYTLTLLVTDPDLLIVNVEIEKVTGNLLVEVDGSINSVATVEVTMQDDGGIALGGVDSSVVQFNVHHYADINMDPNFIALDPNDPVYKNKFDVCRQ